MLTLAAEEVQADRQGSRHPILTFGPLCRWHTVAQTEAQTTLGASRGRGSAEPHTPSLPRAPTQKTSKRRIATPQTDIELSKRRLELV
jgi:hypothetical protein